MGQNSGIHLRLSKKRTRRFRCGGCEEKILKSLRYWYIWMELKDPVSVVDRPCCGHESRVLQSV